MEESGLRKDVNDIKKNVPPSFKENGKSKCRRLEREKNSFYKACKMQSRDLIWKKSIIQETEAYSLIVICFTDKMNLIGIL